MFWPDATQNATRIVVAPCDGTCCPADRSTTGALSDADPGWGVPDGELDQSDLDYFLDQHATALAGGINVIQVDRNEDGTVDAADIAEFQAQLAAGCNDCPADVNGDGLATPADFNAWILAFNAMAPECDQNGDGLCDPSDFNAWVLNFNNGC